MALGRDPQVLMMKVNGRISERSMQSRSASEKINSACRLEHFGEWVSRVGRGGTIAGATWGAVSSDFTTLSLPSLWTRKQKALKKMFSTLASVDVQFSSIAQSCLTLCDRMKRSMPGLPIHHQLLESTQTHVHWCHPTISSSVVPFSSCPQSFPASGSFPMNQLFASGGQSIGVSASTSVLPNEHTGLISFRMDWLDLLAVQGALKSLLQHHSSRASILLCSAFFIVQLSHP